MKTALLYIITLGLYHFFKKGASPAPAPEAAAPEPAPERVPEPIVDEGNEESAAEEGESGQ